MEKKSFLIYLDNSEEVEMLSDQQAGKLLKSLMKFATNGEKPDFSDGMLRMAFSFMSRAIERDTEKYMEICKKRSEYGKKGRAKISKQKQADTDTEKDKETDNDNVNDIVSDIVNDIETERFSAEAENLLKIYSDICRSLPKTKKINKEDIRSTKNLLSVFSEDDIKEVFEKAERNTFLKGRKKDNKVEWKAGFHWIIKPENFRKVFEGKYDAYEETTKEYSDEEESEYSEFVNDF